MEPKNQHESSNADREPQPIPDAERIPEVIRATSPKIPGVIATAVGVIVVIGGILIWRAESKTNAVALSSTAKPVSFVEATSASFHPSRTYVGRLDPWISANVGPQFISAYVDTVLVRPGAVVTRGQVLATLDCRNASATAQAVAMQARALDAQQVALAHESSRVSGLLDGGFVSPNEAEQKSSQSDAKEAELLAEKAKIVGSSLEVNDCVMRAPFDGEIATRSIDPGAFVRPGTPIVSVVDRSTVRMTADVPEGDFDIVAPDKPVHVAIYARHIDVIGRIARRAPAADAATRTVHIEIDIADPSEQIPVGTTGEVRVDVGDPLAAVQIPLAAATIRDTKATIFRLDGDIARTKTFTILGESEGMLFAAPNDIAAGTHVVTEGRALLKDGDKVAAKIEVSAPMPSPSTARTP